MTIRIIYLIGLLVILTSCAIHKIDIQQGNVLTCDTVKQIKPGMSRKQVSFLLGNPTITDPFHHDRWDYPYSYKSGDSDAAPERHHVTVFFDGDNVARVSTTMTCSD
jgi:outer membrane protein assembly factor BamE